MYRANHKEWHRIGGRCNPLVTDEHFTSQPRLFMSVEELDRALARQAECTSILGYAEKIVSQIRPRRYTVTRAYIVALGSVAKSICSLRQFAFALQVLELLHVKRSQVCVVEPRLDEMDISFFGKLELGEAIRPSFISDQSTSTEIIANKPAAHQMSSESVRGWLTGDSMFVMAFHCPRLVTLGLLLETLRLREKGRSVTLIINDPRLYNDNRDSISAAISDCLDERLDVTGLDFLNEDNAFYGLALIRSCKE